MNLKDHHIEPISTAPHDQGRELQVVIEWGEGRNKMGTGAYWWRHWSTTEGCWWSPVYGVIHPIAWVNE